MGHKHVWIDVPPERPEDEITEMECLRCGQRCPTSDADYD